MPFLYLRVRNTGTSYLPSRETKEAEGILHGANSGSQEILEVHVFSAATRCCIEVRKICAVLCSECKGGGVNSVNLFNGRFKAGDSLWL
ncbi:unnamed protein product [Dovyalis caffra]|uniref:BSD2 cysteine rich domain-containing protein n=1 Tax=Dovyalis caffra TaxID=77055 RepID=A0AAV1RSN9_9ROSI|nr:unnamed protein product [Dovyalis caffra]